MVVMSIVGRKGCGQDAWSRGLEEATLSPHSDLGPPGCHGAGERSPQGTEAEGALQEACYLAPRVVDVFAFSYWRAQPGSYSSLCPFSDPEPCKALASAWTLLFAEQMVVLLCVHVDVLRACREGLAL